MRTIASYVLTLVFISTDLVHVLVTWMSCAKMAELIETPFWRQTRIDLKNHLANTVEQLVIGSNACCLTTITLATYYPPLLFYYNLLQPIQMIS